MSATGGEPPTTPAAPLPSSAAATRSPPEIPFDDPKSCDASFHATSDAPPSGTEPSWPSAALDGHASPTMIGIVAGQGRLAPEVIRKVVRGHYPVVRTCYEVGLRRHPRLEGTVILRFVIDRDGKVPEVGVAAASDLPDCALWSCMRDAFQQLEFPPPEDGIVKVSYPIRLEPG